MDNQPIFFRDIEILSVFVLPYDSCVVRFVKLNERQVYSIQSKNVITFDYDLVVSVIGVVTVNLDSL